MAETEISVASYQATLAACADAIESGDWTTAKRKCAVAETILAAFDVEAKSSEVSSRMRESLNAIREAIDSAQGAAANAASGSRLGRLHCKLGRS